jgi:uncharacterized protein (DUF427 family)
VRGQPREERIKVGAMWKGAVLAESERAKVVDGRHPWKGEAGYYEVIVGDSVNPGAAWCYPRPKPAARVSAGHVAFWKGVEIADDSTPVRRGPVGLSRSRG